MDTSTLLSRAQFAFTIGYHYLFPSGDMEGLQVTAYQPAKLAGMEGLFQTEKGEQLRRRQRMSGSLLSALMNKNTTNLLTRNTHPRNGMITNRRTR